MRKPAVKRIDIENLNQKSFSIPIKNNKLILIEPDRYNTMHKVIHLIYLFCKGDTDEIDKNYSINSIAITYEDDEIKLLKREKANGFLVKDKYGENIPDQFRIRNNHEFRHRMKVFYNLEEYFSFLKPHFNRDNYLCMVGNSLTRHDIGRKYIKNRERANYGTCDFKDNDLSIAEKAVITYLKGIGLPGNPLSKYTNFMLMTYPETGLPVSSQKTILPDILRQEDYCSGLIAATHSPFIFDNELEEYTHSLDEFEV